MKPWSFFIPISMASHNEALSTSLSMASRLVMRPCVSAWLRLNRVSDMALCSIPMGSAAGFVGIRRRAMRSGMAIFASGPISLSALIAVTLTGRLGSVRNDWNLAMACCFCASDPFAIEAATMAPSLVSSAGEFKRVSI